MQTTEQMISAFTNALNNLQEYNQMCFDFWYTELFNLNDEWIMENVTASNLKLIEQDVMHSMDDLLVG